MLKVLNLPTGNLCVMPEDEHRILKIRLVEGMQVLAMSVGFAIYIY